MERGESKCTGYFLRLEPNLARAQWPHPTSATRGGMRLFLSGLFFAGNLHRPWKAPPPSCWCWHVQHDLSDRLFSSPSAMLVAPFFLEIARLSVRWLPETH